MNCDLECENLKRKKEKISVFSIVWYYRFLLLLLVETVVLLCPLRHSFFFAVVGNKLVLFGVDGKPCDIETALEKNRNGSGGSDGDGIIPSYQL